MKFLRILIIVGVSITPLFYGKAQDVIEFSKKAKQDDIKGKVINATKDTITYIIDDDPEFNQNSIPADGVKLINFDSDKKLYYTKRPEPAYISVNLGLNIPTGRYAASDVSNGAAHYAQVGPQAGIQGTYFFFRKFGLKFSFQSFGNPVNEDGLFSSLSSRFPETDYDFERDRFSLENDTWEQNYFSLGLVYRALSHKTVNIDISINAAQVSILPFEYDYGFRNINTGEENQIYVRNSTGGSNGTESDVTKRKGAINFDAILKFLPNKRVSPIVHLSFLALDDEQTSFFDHHLNGSSIFGSGSSTPFEDFQWDQYPIKVRAFTFSIGASYNFGLNRRQI